MMGAHSAGRAKPACPKIAASHRHSSHGERAARQAGDAPIIDVLMFRYVS